MKRLIITITAALITILWIAALYPETGDEVITAFKKRMNSIDKISGTITYTSSTGQNYSGDFIYMAPGRIHIKFSNPHGKLLVANAKKLWLYDPLAKVCAIQDLDVETGMSGGITGILEGYSYELVPQGEKEYALKFVNEQKEPSNIILYLDDSFFIKRGALHKSGDEGFSFSISNVNYSPDVVKKIFDFDVPPNVQIIKNPLNVK